MATLTLDVAASADDAGVRASDLNNLDLTNTQMMLPGNPESVRTRGGWGWRFTGVTLAQGTTVNSATMTLVCSTGSWSSKVWRWVAIAQDNTAAFANSSGNFPGDRPISSNIAPETLDLNRVAGTSYTLPTTGTLQQTLGAAIGEVVGRAGWSSGNALAIVVNSAQDPASSLNNSGEGYAAYDHATYAPARLAIDYTAPVQHARPSSDVSNAGGWSDQGGGSTNLYAAIDESSVNEADYIRSPVSPSSATVEVALGTITDPNDDTGHEIRLRVRSDIATPLALTAALYQGAVEIASWSPTIPTSWADRSYQLDAATQAANISNYADLRLRFTATETPAAPTYVGSGTMVNTATSGATMAPTPPTHQAGDILVLVCHTSSNGDFTDAITNWTKLASGTETNTTGQKVECWWRYADGTAADNPTVPGIANTNVRTARIFAVRGAANQAPTVQRSNNAASATVTFPAATATAATTLSVLAYAYEDDPSAASAVTGFSGFNVGTTATGTDAAMGMNATRTNASSGSKAGGTSTVSGGTFANSVNVGLHFIFEPLVGGRVQIAWAEFVAPLASALTAGQNAAIAYNVKAPIGDTAALAYHVRTTIADSQATAFGVRTPLGDSFALAFVVKALAGDTAPLAFHTKAALGDQAALAYHVRAILGDSQPLAFHTRASLGDTLPLAYHVRAAQGDSLPIAWDVLSSITAIGDTAILAWGVRTLAGDQAPFAFDIRGIAGDQAPLAFAIRSRIGDQVDVAYRLRALLGDTQATAYHVRAILGDQAALAFHLRALAGDAAPISYNVRAPLGDQAALAWGVRVAVADSQALAFAVRTPLGDTVALAFRVRTIAGDQAALAFVVRQAIGDSQPFSWHTLSITPTAANSAILAWAVRAAAADTLPLAFRVRSTLGDQAALAFHLRTIAGDQAALSFRVRALAGDSLAAGWIVRALAGDEAALAWIARALAGDAAPLSWRTAALAGDDLPLGFRTRGLVVPAPQDLSWAVRALAGDDLPLGWDVASLLKRLRHPSAQIAIGMRGFISRSGAGATIGSGVRGRLRRQG